MHKHAIHFERVNFGSGFQVNIICNQRTAIGRLIISLTPQKATQDFYSGLPAFVDFREVADLKHYQALPDDWTLIVSDVVESTRAIKRGEYKNVNMVGAAFLTAVINVSEGVSLPFVFGGDGGVIAVPPSLLNSACEEAGKLQAASLNLFGLSLRTAAIPVSALRSSGADILVGKYHLSEGNHLAMFAGNGVAMADEWLKADVHSKGYALLPNEDNKYPDLQGLSCRWEPLKAKNGTMLTTILLPYNIDATKEIQTITDAIGDILGDQISNFAPAHDSTLKFRFPPSGLSLEIAAGAHSSNRFKRTIWAYLTALIQYFCERFGVSVGDYNGATYREELKSNTDYRKYDGALRMVLDVSPQQAARIEDFLELEYQAKKVIYGTWKADQAMMTCLLFSLSESKHVHFIDGADGGYAMAASDLKLRMKGTTKV
ncbi:DUF3095 domain-containing protein [Roseovarius sp. EL26]|uniref:DUF3095 domain-containing protein n=1 Tax=Roseovarius sp. EL26 TaxID=2126672 RepID=UPI000EA3DBD1|nr:DUF3095 domain-containing protein [Roseovarius sp. EL26]